MSDDGTPTQSVSNVADTSGGGSIETAGTIAEAIQGMLEEFDVQPILFVGAGIARRYMGAPDWDGALQYALSVIEGQKQPYSYFVQKYADNKIAIGTAIADLIFEWAWSSGKDKFDSSLFEGTDRHVFIKSLISDYLRGITPDDLSSLSKEYSAEIAALRDVRPHAVITTNYDQLLELIFNGYEPIVGRSVLRYDLNSFGEIFHIHGMDSDPTSIILTQPDYNSWHKQSRYFAAKLLTYFVEHPVFIFGYSLGDPNVRTILQDIGRIAADDSGLVSNVAQVVWHTELKAGPNQSEAVIDDEDDKRQYRIRVFNVTSLQDIFDLLAARHDLKQVNPALLRSLAARLMKLTRKDIPSGNIEVDYATLEKAVQDDKTIPAMLGLTLADSDNKTHPYTLTQVADELGLKGWNHVNPVLKRIKAEKGIDLRASDNRYHERIKTGKKESSAVRKWSHEAVSLFSDILAGKEYEVQS